MQRTLVRDLRSHGLRATAQKRLAEIEIGATKYSFRALLALEADELASLLATAVRDKQHQAAAFTYEALAQVGGDPARAWTAVSHALSHEDESDALAALHVILRSVDDPWWLTNIPQTRRCLYLLGRHFVGRAAQAQGNSQTALEQNRSLALSFLGRAREMRATRDGVDALALAAAYESALYARFTSADVPNE